MSSSTTARSCSCASAPSFGFCWVIWLPSFFHLAASLATFSGVIFSRRESTLRTTTSWDTLGVPLAELECRSGDLAADGHHRLHDLEFNLLVVALLVVRPGDG